MPTPLEMPLPPNATFVEGSDGYLIEVDGQIQPNYDATIPTFDDGDVVTGTVVRIDNDEILVDIGYKSEGVIPVGELSIRKHVNVNEEVQLGEEIDALVLTKEDPDGRLILSKKRARFEKAWKRIEGAAESGEPVEGSVIEVVKGGLIIDLGVRGFLPASLVDIRRVQDLDEFLGQTLTCKVIELNRSRNNVVLSRRAVLEEERREVRQKILDSLQPGETVIGTISNIVDFGAFVDLNGIDGLIHISELSWSHVNHPSEILKIGDEVTVKVLDIDRERQRISLGLKQTQADPWQQVIDEHMESDVVPGVVTKVVTFGAFVEIRPGVEGLVHISELAAYHVENPREVVNQGDKVTVKIIEIDGERRRLSLSLKRVLPEEVIVDERNFQPIDDGEPLDDTGAEEYAPPAAAATATAELDEATTARSTDEPAEGGDDDAGDEQSEAESTEEPAEGGDETVDEAVAEVAEEPSAEAAARGADETAAAADEPSAEAADDPSAAAGMDAAGDEPSAEAGDEPSAEAAEAPEIQTTEPPEDPMAEPPADPVDEPAEEPAAEPADADAEADGVGVPAPEATAAESAADADAAEAADEESPQATGQVSPDAEADGLDQPAGN